MIDVEPIERRQRLVGAGTLADVVGRHVGGRGPVDAVRAGRNRGDEPGHRGQEDLGLLLDRRGALAGCCRDPGGPPATQATATQATRMPRPRIEVRMPETYLNPAALVDGHCAW